MSLREFQVLTPGDEPFEGHRINAECMTTTADGVLELEVGGELVAAFRDWTEAHRVHKWPETGPDDREHDIEGAA